jgi:hypothetical protein
MIIDDIFKDIRVGDSISIDVRHQHEEYNDMYSSWEKCRDCYEGEKAIKRKGEVYLPALSNQDPLEYEKYKERAQFYGATSRTVEAYLGMIFRKPVTFKARHNNEETDEFNEFIKDYLRSITGDGKNFNEFIHEVTQELIVVNRVGILVDMPPLIVKESGFVSLQEYEYMGNKPMLTMYKAESIINWHTERFNGRILPVFYVLEEPSVEFNSKSLIPEPIAGYRILYLENWDDVQNRRYKNILINYNSAEKGGGAIVKEVSYPVRDGEYLKEIPFYPLSDKGLDYRKVYHPMIEDLASVNIGHYRNSADNEQDLHWTSLKSIFVPGIDADKIGSLRIGGATAVPKDCTPVLIEPKSDSAIRAEMVLKEARLAVLGAERISQKSRYLPSAETARITQATESSQLQNTILNLSNMITRIMNVVFYWAKPAFTKWKGDIDIDVIVNSDMSDDLITAADMKNAMFVLQQGGMSWDTYYHLLEKREVYPVGWTKEKEWEALARTQQWFLQHAAQDIVMGETSNPFFRSDEAENKTTENEQIQSGTGADVTPNITGATSKVRIS